MARQQTKLKFLQTEIENSTRLKTNFSWLLVYSNKKQEKYIHTVVCKIVHKFASVWCKTALGEVGVSLP